MASNFGDPYRMDKRTPWVGEEEMDMSPLDAAEMGINDGDYVWVDANKEDRPYVGADQPGASADPLHEVSRLMIRVKFNPSLPRKHLIIIHGLNGATHASVQAQKTNPDGSAKTEQGYSSAVRFGSQQSVVRGWIQPTQMTETLAHKDYFTQDVKVGFQVDTHTPTGCPKEVLVKVTFAEKGGLNAEGAWAPGTTGYTPGNENDTMKKFLAGGFIE
jgi:nitrate reductase alpha subunit